MAKQVLLHHKAFAAKRSLKGKRIGVIELPASWLVASHVDYLLASQRWGVNYIDIPLQEVYKRFYEITDDEIGLEASIFANKAKACQDATAEDLLKYAFIQSHQTAMCIRATRCNSLILFCPCKTIEYHRMSGTILIK